MIYIKDGLTREKLTELFQYSLQEHCLFPMAIKPNTNILNDHVFKELSVIKFLKIEEGPYREILNTGKEEYFVRFSVKVLVEDHYWEGKSGTDWQTNDKVLSGVVPRVIHVDVCKILFG